MHHDLVWVVWSVGLEALAPVVADGVGEDVAVEAEARARDWGADGWVALEAVLGVLVPEVESSVRAGCAEGAVDWVEGDGVDCVDAGDVAGWWVAVALERKVGTEIC